jgi:hypothetical protein
LDNDGKKTPGPFINEMTEEIKEINSNSIVDSRFIEFQNSSKIIN